VVYVAAEMTVPDVSSTTAGGDLVVEARKSLPFSGGPGIPCVISTNIEGELLDELITNCAFNNAISALTRSKYLLSSMTPECGMS